MSNSGNPCFLILAHADPDQFQRLLTQLSPYADIYIHLDEKANIEDFRPNPCPVNIHFISKRKKLKWGGYSIVKAEFRLIEAALASGKSYSHFVLLSGACYPIKPLTEIISYFSSRPDHSFIRFADMNSGVGNRMCSFRKINFGDIISVRDSKYVVLRLSQRLEDLLYDRLGVRLPCPKSMSPVFGSQWWALTPECARYVVNTSRSKFFYRWRFKLIWAPDEIVFHTLLANSPYSEKTDGLHYMNPEEVTDHQMVSKLANFHIIDLMLTKTFTLSDWAEISSSDRLFVRKVSSKESATLLDKIDIELLS